MDIVPKEKTPWLFFGVVLFTTLISALPSCVFADFEVFPTLSAQHNLQTVIEDVSFDQSDKSILDGRLIEHATTTWDIHFLHHSEVEEVPSSRAVYLLAQVEDLDEFRVAPTYTTAQAPIPAGDGVDETIESQSIDFSTPLFGDPRTPAGIYGLFVFSLPESKSVCEVEEPFDCASVPYTEEDFSTWFFYEFQVDYATFEGEVPETYGPDNMWALQFDYVPKEEESCFVDCFSSVLFIPGIKGSVLTRDADTLWPPTFWSNDVSQLAFTEGGESVNEVKVTGILNSFYGVPIYSPLTSFFDGLVQDETIAQWTPLAYDWRYTPQSIVTHGIETEGGTIDVIAEIERLSEHSKSGKVTIVAHSLGGMLAKAIIKKLEEEGKDHLIDTVVMVGTPELGTPQALSALLHGDGEGLLGGFIVNSIAARSIAQHMPSAYMLLPSSQYFEEVLDAPIVFDSASSFTDAWRARWATSTDAYAEYEEFIKGEGVTREKPPVNTLRLPEVVDAELFDAVAEERARYASYAIPAHIREVRIAGWGSPTVKAVNYTTQHFLKSYDTLFTREGDGTVVYPSVTTSGSGEKYFFNLDKYRDPKNKQVHHRDLLNSDPIQELLENLIEQKELVETSYVVSTKPTITNIEDELIVSTHSPVVLGAYDEFGNFTGIDPTQDLSREVLTIREDIPGSSFVYSSESQHLFLPKFGTYRFVYTGVGSGPTTVTVRNFTGDATTDGLTFSDIPTEAQTRASFSLSGGALDNVAISLDRDGDGVIDANISPDSAPSLIELLALLKGYIAELSIKNGTKKNLIKKVERLEKKIAVQKDKNKKILTALKKKIEKASTKKKLEGSEGLLDALTALEMESDEVFLKSEALRELKEAILATAMKDALRKVLLARVARLENKQTLIGFLGKFTHHISLKKERNKISEGDAEKIIELLTEIENTL